MNCGHLTNWVEGLLPPVILGVGVLVFISRLFRTQLSAFPNTDLNDVRDAKHKINEMKIKVDT